MFRFPKKKGYLTTFPFTITVRKSMHLKKKKERIIKITELSPYYIFDLIEDISQKIK